MTFLQTAISPHFQRIFFHQTLYLHYVQNKPTPAPKILPNLAGDFFPTIRKLKAAKDNIDLSTIKSVYDFLIADTLRVEDQEADPTQRSLIPLRCERSHPDTDWKRSWRLARLKGLGPDLSSFILKMLWGILHQWIDSTGLSPKNTLTLCDPCALYQAHNCFI